MSDLPKIDVYNFKYQLEAPKPGLTIFKPQGGIFMSFMQLSLIFECELFAS